MAMLAPVPSDESEAKSVMFFAPIPRSLAVGPLETLEGIGRVVEVRQDEVAEEAASRVRLLVGDADAAVPEVTEVLNGADLRYLDIPKPSFDKVFFRLVRGTSESA